MTHTRVFQSLWTEQKRINAFRGGARSSKTWSILQAISFWLFTGKFGKQDIPTGNCSIVRETLPSLRASAYKDFIEILHECKMYSKIDHRKTLLEFHFNGRSVDFFSTDDLQSAKLRGRQHSICFIEEANTVSFEAFNQMIMRTKNFMLLSYNPAGIENWCKTFIEGERMERGDVKLDVSTYKDNPFLPPAMVDEIIGLKETDYDLYQVYTLGNWVKSRNLVFEKVHLIKEMPVGERDFFGIDFGWNDETACVRCVIIDKDLFIDEIFHEKHLMLGDIAERLHMIGAPKLYGDHEPRTIRELKSRGIRIKPAKKGKDSIRQGLGFIRQHRIHITERSLATIKAFREYKYKLDENNNPTDVPLDVNSHAIDATRYALSYALRRKITIR